MLEWLKNSVTGSSLFQFTYFTIDYSRYTFDYYTSCPCCRVSVSPFMFAALTGADKVMDWFLNSNHSIKEIEDHPYKGKVAARASFEGDIAFLEYLLAKGIDFNKINVVNMIIEAVIEGNQGKIIDWLFTKGKLIDGIGKSSYIFGGSLEEAIKFNEGRKDNIQQIGVREYEIITFQGNGEEKAAVLENYDIKRKIHFWNSTANLMKDLQVSAVTHHILKDIDPTLNNDCKLLFAQTISSYIEKLICRKNFGLIFINKHARESFKNLIRQ